ncbi:MAG: Asp-tRNA(Asn)/Glu-tRNA(Gln) amidotransferase subunit GatC [Desulfovibrio sp.]|jgi:aspartyl-tRNA(Asn)/glutamyl-tRNA(Gln) amidotransferase subunit C|nr:Asp-tRNA(Asn)/Glu-tRNA(Gln) amidotransferase subunit GatC [Desulfovibrio sp.]
MTVYAPCAHRVLNGPLQGPDLLSAKQHNEQGQAMSDKHISREDVVKMAALSRLRVGEEEQTLFSRQFQDILGSMNTLAGVNTDGVPPLYSPAAHTARCREDTPAALCGREEALANAPAQNGEYFMVPRII